MFLDVKNEWPLNGNWLPYFGQVEALMADESAQWSKESMQMKKMVDVIAARNRRVAGMILAWFVVWIVSGSWRSWAKD